MLNDMHSELPQNANYHINCIKSNQTQKNKHRICNWNNCIYITRNPKRIKCQTVKTRSLPDDWSSVSQFETSEADLFCLWPHSFILQSTSSLRPTASRTDWMNTSKIWADSISESFYGSSQVSSNSAVKSNQLQYFVKSTSNWPKSYSVTK